MSLQIQSAFQNISEPSEPTLYEVDAPDCPCNFDITEDSDADSIDTEVDYANNFYQNLDSYIDQIEADLERLRKYRGEVEEYKDALERFSETVRQCEVTVEIEITARSKEEFLEKAEQAWDDAN